MARIEPLSDAEAKAVSDAFAVTENRLGFVPNSQKTLGHRPEIFDAAAKLGAAVFGPGLLDTGFKMLIALMVSRSAGCSYCQAHTGYFATEAGVPLAKEAALWDYETSPLFSDAERAALTVAQLSGQVPNAVTDADFAALKRHYGDAEIVELVAVLGYMGWTNRMNDTLAIDLEERPRRHAEAHLAGRGWRIGKHAGDQ